MSPIFSVVIPAYNQAEFLQDAVQSILDQTCQDFEILIVNDASTDRTPELMAQFTDPRIICLTHEQNRGLPAARNTGMAAARGDLIALLDADDVYHPRKFEEHLRFYQAHPEISITYNARYEWHHSSKKIRDIYRPPAAAGLKDFVLGFPFSPSDMVIRRETAQAVNFFDANARCGGEDLDFPIRLALAGYQFARVTGALNFRRYHGGRKKKKLRCRFGDYTRALDDGFLDPRCPAEVLALRKKAYANHYTEVACWALAQGERELGAEIIREILLLDPSAARTDASDSRLVHALFNYCVRDETLDHEAMLPQVFASLPADLAVPAAAVSALVARGFLIKGTRSAMWADAERADAHLSRAAALGARADAQYCQQIAARLIAYYAEAGPQTGADCEQRLFAHLQKHGWASAARQIRGIVSVNKAFDSYDCGDYPGALRQVWQAVSNHPAYLGNRGVLSVAAKSVFQNNKNRAGG